MFAARAHMNFSNALVRKGDVTAERCGSEGSSSACPGRLRDASHFSADAGFFRDLGGDHQASFGARLILEPQKGDCMTISARCCAKIRRARRSRGIFRSASLQPNYCASAFSSRRFALPGKISRRGRQHLKTAVELNSADAGAHYYLAQVLRSKGEIEAAIRELQACVALKPDFPTPKTTWACCSNTAATLNKPSRIWQAVKAQPENPDVTQ